jgi:Putative adhesin
MKQMTVKATKLLCGGLLAVWLLALPAAARVVGAFERTYPVSGAGELEVLTHSGDVTVHAGPAGSVVVKGKIVVGENWLMGDKTADVQELEKNPPIRQSGDHIVIDYVNLRNIAIDFDITVPAEISLQIRTGSGDQTVEGLRKGATLEAGSGDLRIRDLTGELHTETGSGNVRAQGLSGALRAQAGSGDIEVDETGAGDVDVRTGSGNIQVHGVKGAAHVKAGSGDVTLEGEPTGEWQAHTGSGNVSLRLPQNAAFDLDVSTSSGSLDVGRPVTMTVTGRIREHPRTVKGKVNGGGPLVSVETGSGDVQID